jgi:hypothetical protein
MLNVVMLSVTIKYITAAVFYGKCRYAECHRGKCRGADSVMKPNSFEFVKNIFFSNFDFCYSDESVKTNVFVINKRLDRWEILRPFTQATFTAKNARKNALCSVHSSASSGEATQTGLILFLVLRHF